jgi:hypothetical protein
MLLCSYTADEHLSVQVAAKVAAHVAALRHPAFAGDLFHRSGGESLHSFCRFESEVCCPSGRATSTRCPLLGCPSTILVM